MNDPNRKIVVDRWKTWMNAARVSLDAHGRKIILTLDEAETLFADLNQAIREAKELENEP